jgi:hypothetical protein
MRFGTLKPKQRAYYSTMRELGMLATEDQHKMWDFSVAYEQGDYDEYVNCVEYDDPVEYANVGAATGGGFEHTSELKPMKYKVAMQRGDTSKWKIAVDEEHDRMLKHGVCQAILRKDLPQAAKLITSKWAMKKNSSGTFRARLNARGYEQVDGIHYQSDETAVPVSSETSIRIMFVLTILGRGWVGELLDISGAFLHGDFGSEDEPIHMEYQKGLKSIMTHCTMYYYC